jgi:hypothetical protein
VKNILNLTEEKLIITPGHTLSFIEKEDEIYAYLGQVDWSKIELWKGKDLYSLKFEKLVIPDKRWATAIKDKDSEDIYIFCTGHRDSKIDIYKYQDIYLYKSNNGIDFSFVKTIVWGSAPFQVYLNGMFNLFYHRKDDGVHQILVKAANKIENIDIAQEIVVIEIPIRSVDEALSAPSVIYLNNKYYMLCEYRENGGPWTTVLYESDNIFSNWKLIEMVYNNWRACAFHYLLKNKYYVTYSVLNGNIWSMAIQEADINA